MIQVAKKVETPSAKTAFRIGSASSLIVASADSTGTMNVVVSGGKVDTKPVGVSIVGADVLSAAAVRGMAIDGSGGTFTIRGNGETQFSLRNLFPGQVVKVQMVDEKDRPIGTALTCAVY